MKVLLLIFICALNLSLINTSNGFIHRKVEKIPNVALRNIEETSKLKLMLVGFGNYRDTRFDIYFKEYNNSNLYKDEYLNLNVTLSYENGSNIAFKCVKKEVDNAESQEKDTRIYSCGDVDKNTTQKVQLLNYKFYNKSNNDKIDIEIVQSSLANSTKNNILASENPLNFTTFYFDDVSVYESTAEIMGNLEKYEQNNEYIINIGEKPYKCEVNNTKIKFNLEKSAKENLIGKMLLNSSNYEPMILIFSNKTKEYYLYYFSLYGFLGFNKYQEPSNNKDATNLANFRGTKGTFKEYLKFNISISTETSNLRNLQEINSTAYGKWDDSNSDYNNGLITYHVTLGNTMGKNIVNINRITDFEFSSNNATFEKYYQLKNLTKISENLMEKRGINYMPFNYIECYSDNKTNISCIFNAENEIQLNNIENQANLSYTQSEDNQEEETNLCFISKYEDFDFDHYNFYLYILNCTPKHDIKAKYSSLGIKIDNEIKTKSRLRFLESSGNITQLYPGEDVSGNRNIEFEYNPDIKTFKRESGKGLSGGAIAGIVLGSVAAAVAVGIAIYCLTRKSPSTMPANNANFQDSSININK